MHTYDSNGCRRDGSQSCDKASCWMAKRTRTSTASENRWWGRWRQTRSRKWGGVERILSLPSTTRCPLSLPTSTSFLYTQYSNGFEELERRRHSESYSDVKSRECHPLRQSWDSSVCPQYDAWYWSTISVLSTCLSIAGEMLVLCRLETVFSIVNISSSGMANTLQFFGAQPALQNLQENCLSGRH